MYSLHREYTFFVSLALCGGFVFGMTMVQLSTLRNVSDVWQ